MPQVSSVIDFESVQRARDAAQNKQPSALYLEVSQQISQQLQTTLELEEIITLFFNASQHILQYEAIQYVHSAQKVSIRKGSPENIAHAVHYHLSFEGEYLGDLAIESKNTLPEYDLASFEGLTSKLVFPLRNALKYHAAIQSALLDPLTGVGNRACMSSTLQRDIDTAQRFQQPLSIIMLDIDHFKSINDMYGHACGDLALQEIASMLKKQLRNTDAVFRFGGEEFLVTLPNTNVDQAYRVAERIRQAVEGLELSYARQSLNLSVSLGCTSKLANEDQQGLICRADQALYQAKRLGRNRTEVL